MRIYELQARRLALDKRLARDKEAFSNFTNISLQHITHVQEHNDTPRVYLSRSKSKREVSQIQHLYEGIIQDKRRRMEGQRSLYSSCSTWDFREHRTEAQKR